MTKVQSVLRQLRLSLTQSEISRRTGIAQSKLSRWEAGKIAAGAEEALKLVSLSTQLQADDHQSVKQPAQTGEPSHG